MAIKQDGTLWAWGYNGPGQLGLGDTTNRLTPTQVGTDTDWDIVTAADNFTVAIKQNGTLPAWGWNGLGQLGLGDTVDRNVPVQIGVDTTWQSVSSGSLHTVATKQNGTLWAWGINEGGQLGLGNYTARNVPVQVGSDTDWQSVSSGEAFTLATKQNGTLWAWGRNYHGQLGLGDATERNAPDRVGTDTTWQKVVACRAARSLARKANGTLWGWGQNGIGALGLGDVSDRLTPTQIGSASWQDFAGAYGTVIAIKTDGTLWSAGSRDYGLRGDGVSPLAPAQMGESTEWGGPLAYPASGSITGLKINAGSGNFAQWKTLSWASAALPVNTSIRFRVRTSDDNSSYSAWSNFFTQSSVGSTSGTGDLTTAGVADSQYLELEMNLTSSDTLYTPTLQDFTLSYGVLHLLDGTVSFNSSGLSGVDVTDNTLGTTTTDGSGNFSFGFLPAGTSYTLSPSKSGYDFTPPSSSGTLTASTSVTFTAATTTTTSTTSTSTTSTSTTLPTPIAISNLRVTKVKGTSAILRWSTNEASNSQVQCSLPKRKTRSASNSALTLEHSLKVRRLPRKARIRCTVTAQSGTNQTTTSAVIRFKTKR